RAMQKRLAEEVTVMVHGREAYDSAVEASQILFGKATTEALRKIDEQTLLAVFDGVPQFSVDKALFNEGVNVIDLLAEKANVFPSKGELRRTIKGGGMSINKEKVTDAELMVNASALLNDKYLLVQKGKKNYFLVIAQ
ncbi:MAG: tyrosine--tRNA ligase, partial [Carboxylicivirga sp.]|nr:tyrosine--tRNA ligase [Carboxylicivirga sp.]